MIKIIEVKDCALHEISFLEIYSRKAILADALGYKREFELYERRIRTPKDWDAFPSIEQKAYSTLIPKDYCMVVDIETGELRILNINTRVRKVVQATIEIKG